MFHSQPPTTPEFEQLVDAYESINDITSQIQDEIVKVLITDDKRKQQLTAQLKKSENDMQEEMNNAVYGFVGAMPLASMNHSNLFMQALALHSSITGNQLLRDVLMEVNRRTMAKAN